MQTVKLDLIQRINLEIILPQLPGDPDASDAFGRVAETIKLTDTERAQINYRVYENGQVGWKADDPETGKIDANLESADAKLTLQGLKRWQGYRYPDKTWRDLLFAELEAKK